MINAETAEAQSSRERRKTNSSLISAAIIIVGLAVCTILIASAMRQVITTWTWFKFNENWGRRGLHESKAVSQLNQFSDRSGPGAKSINNDCLDDHFGHSIIFSTTQTIAFTGVRCKAVVRPSCTSTTTSPLRLWEIKQLPRELANRESVNLQRVSPRK